MGTAGGTEENAGGIGANSHVAGVGNDAGCTGNAKEGPCGVSDFTYETLKWRFMDEEFCGHVVTDF